MNHKTIKLISAFLILSGLISCGSKKGNEDMVAPQGMNILDLSPYGKPFAIFVPDTTTNKLSVTEQSSGALDIELGKSFAISIFEQAADIELRKNDIRSDEVNKLKTFITDEPSAILWESEITQPEYHFIINQKIGDSEYSIEDLRVIETNTFGKEDIQKMFESCKNIKEIKKKTHS